MEDNINKEQLLAEFPPVTTEAWEALIQQDLKGADYEKKLIWKTIDGLKLKPYYRSEDTDNLYITQCLPQNKPYIRGNRSNDNNWLIREDIKEENPSEANKKARYAISKGAESLALNVSACKNLKDMMLLLEGINLQEVPIHFYGASSYIQLFDLLLAAVTELGFDSQKLHGSLNFDSVGYYLAHGRFYASIDSNFVELSLLFDKAKRDFPLFKLINVNADLTHDSGGSLIQEVAYALAIGVEYLNNLTAKGQDADTVAQRMQFTFAISSNYFLEIAKIRAARLLWSNIVEQYSPKNNGAKYMHIHSVNSKWNKTLFDPYVNMLRCTTEAMSAAIGGCDSMTVLPFDFCYKKSGVFSERIARNLQIILKEEAYLNRTIDIAGGSYYLENLTETVAEAAWKNFLDIESKGGFIAKAQNGEISIEIETIAQRNQEELATRKQILLGTNQYPNSNEKMLPEIEPQTQASLLKGKKNIRLAQAYEALRLATEDYVSKGFSTPKVFLLTIGNLAMRKARAGFSVNFFGCAGFEVIDNNGFETPAKGVEAALKSGAEIIAICSSDEEYTTLGIEIVQSIKKHNSTKIVIIAGNPSEAEMLKNAGVDAFIHVRTNILNTLKELSSKIGII